MLVTAVIQITSCGSSTGPFDVYYDSVAPANLLATNISCTQLVSGYTVTNLPDTATTIVLSGIGLCTDTYTLPIGGTAPTPTPTPTSGVDCSFTFTVNYDVTPTPTPTPTSTPNQSPTPTPTPTQVPILDVFYAIYSVEDLLPFSSDLAQACIAASALNNGATILGQYWVYAMNLDTGTTLYSSPDYTPNSLTGYYIFDINGTFTVVEITSGVITSYPICPTPTPTPTPTTTPTPTNTPTQTPTLTPTPTVTSGCQQVYLNFEEGDPPGCTFVCETPTTPSVYNTYYTSCSPLTVGCTLYYQSGCVNPVASGYYSDGINCYQVNTSGEIVIITSCP